MHNSFNHQFQNQKPRIPARQKKLRHLDKVKKIIALPYLIYNGLLKKEASCRTLLQEENNMNSAPKGLVFDIMKFAIHDGPGIRSAVFLKGCPLHCHWCHNPESIESKPEISFIPYKCISCGYCMRVCPNTCHQLRDKQHVYIRDNCSRCGRCTTECHARALELIGREMSVDEVMGEVLKDLPFYQTSGGGLTLSGGEPMLQFEFSLALMREAKKAGLHVCLETSGFSTGERYEETLPYVDIYLFDVKESDPQKHLEFTGVPLEPILNTLEFLDKHGATIFLRCPIIPGLNARDDHFEAIGRLANSHKAVARIDIEPYHPLGISKSDRIGKKSPLAMLTRFPENEESETWIKKIQALTEKPVSLS